MAVRPTRLGWVGLRRPCWPVRGVGEIPRSARNDKWARGMTEGDARNRFYQQVLGTLRMAEIPERNPSANGQCGTKG